MEPVSSQLEEILSDLSNPEKRLLNTGLTGLSNLGQEEIEHFKLVWPNIDRRRRHEIVRRLVELAEDNVELNFDSIFRYCLGDNDPEVRSQAIEGLWENEAPSLISPLVRLLEQDASDKVQSAAATALGRFALLAEHAKLRAGYSSQVEVALLVAVNDKDKSMEVRRRALEAVAPLSTDRVKAVIREAYRSDSSRLKVSSLYAMGRNCDPSWLSLLLKELSSPDAELRYEAAGACGEIEDPEAVPGLIELVHDPDVDVEIAAIQALGKIGGRRATEYLKQCLSDTSEVIRETAKQALEDLRAADLQSFLPQNRKV